ncbi:Rhs element Vgr protein [Paracoccus sp. S-4012]|uniref:phage baseplate assembly protein V n=1 Tax=Paracoccus sp. S-4012 TaxID=2665648 RepID=UPI001324B004|nr:Rhs element Vgr protein [Paracoccus sp. S-4012]
MNADAYQTLRQIIREELRALRLPELAVVQEIHPHADEGDDDNHACTVRLRDTGLVMARVPVMVHRKGAAAIPDVGDLVLVQFLGGEANAPVIVGSLYNDEDRPPVNAAGDAVLRLPVNAGECEGVELRVSSADAATALLALGPSLKIALKDDDPVVVIEVGGGKATLKIESDGTVTLTSDKAVAIEGGEVSVKGSAVTIEAQGGLKLKGATIDLN